ncbi:MAG: hypothetical protein V1863_04570 [Candidatus Omnitrophota bacterium]
MPLQNNDQYIGQLLIRDGLITDEELKQGLEEQSRHKDFLCTTLVRLGYASEEKIFSILSLQLGVPYVNLREVEIDMSLLTRIPAGIALAFKCMPIRVSTGTFFVAMNDPLNAQAVEELKKYVGSEKVKIFLAGDTDLRESIRKYYGA